MQFHHPPQEMRFSFFIHSTYFIFNNTGSTTEIPGSDSPFLSRVEPGSVTPARRLIGSRPSAVCSWQQSWDSCSVWRALTSVITAASLCEPVAAMCEREAASVRQHVPDGDLAGGGGGGWGAW